MKWFKSHTFWKIFTINVLLICTVLTLMFIVSRVMLPNISQDQYRQVTDKTVKRMKEQINVVIKDIWSLGDEVQQDPIFLSDDEQEIDKELQKIVNISPYIDSGTIFNVKGYVEHYYPNDLKNMKHVNLSKRKYFQEALRTKKIYLSDVVSADTKHYIVVMAIPILDGQQNVKKVVNLALRIEENKSFQSIFQTFDIGENGYTFIVDRNGRIISHPEKQRIGENAKKNEIVQKTMNHKSGYQRVVNTEGKYFFASFEYIPVLDWGIVAELPVEEIYRPYEMFEKTLWIVSGVTILLLSFFTALYARQIVNPIHKLYELAGQVARGNFNQKIPEREIERGEIGILSKQFNEMISYIRHSKANLQQKENQLQEQKTFLRQVIDINPSYIYAINQKREFILVNESFAMLLGEKSDDLIGQSIDKYQFNLQSDLLYKGAFSNCTQKGMVLEEQFKDSKGNRRWVETAKLPIMNEKQEVIQMLCVSTDITERKKAEEKLRTSEKLAVVGELAAGVAHEIKNPLTSLKGFVHLLKEQHPKDALYIDIMETELERMNGIVEEFLMLGKPQVMKVESLNMQALVQEVCSLLEPEAVEKEVAFIFERDDQLPRVYGDKNQLKQVFINIIKNSIEAMPEGGAIHITTKVKENHLWLQLADEGQGIPPERLAKIGEPFYSTKEKGTGLGLMVSYRIIKAHHAQMTFSSQLDKGTSVDILFPIIKK